MFKKAQSYKPKSQKEHTNLEINRVVIESYYGSNRRPESKIIKINNNVYNIKNIDNNMSRGNLNENINNDDKNIKGSESKFKQVDYSLCNQSNLKLISHIKKFDSPLLISNNSFSFLNEKRKGPEVNNNNQIKNEIQNDIKKNFLIKSFDIFICGNQNLKSKNIHITNSTKKDNVVYKEIIDTKINKNEIEEKKFQVDNNLINSLEIINKRWKKEQREFKMRLSYINKAEVFVVNLEKYKQELISKINFDKINTKNNDNCYIFIKQDMKSKEIKFIYEIIKPNSRKDVDDLFNKFIKNDNKENDSNLINNSTPLNNGKKKSKFSNQNSPQVNKINSINISNNSFYPLLIFNYSELKNIISNIEKDLKIPKEKKDNKYILEDNISLNYKGINQKINQRNSPKKEKEKINKKKALLPTKVDEYELINKFDNLIKKKIIELTINKTNKVEKKEKNNSKNIIIKSKDFGQSTPISLLKEKYFIYAVSKWSKYSIINPEINLYYKYSYKSGFPKFDANILKINNFYLGIEKIKLEGDAKKSRNFPNFNSFKKSISTSKVTTQTNNEKNIIQKTKVSNNTNYFLNNNENSTNGRKAKSKQKLEKKKNK